jgi:ABC-type multidrug transport system fused ATPase/permease subunit
MLAGRTALIIAHDLGAVRHADRVLVLEEGMLIEQGTHAELLARGGAYTSLAAPPVDL